MSEIRVSIDIDAEAYPVLSIMEIGNPRSDQGFAIPPALWDNLCRAQEALDEAEFAILFHVAEHYPRSPARQWIGA